MIKIKSYGSGSKGNFYLVSNANTNIILECGINEDEICKALNKNNLQFKDINACITSHCHTDHSQSINYINNYDIHCYITYDTILRYNIENNYTQLLDNNLYKVNDIMFASFSVNHGQCECYGFIFKDKDSTILFITDFMECKKKFHKFAFDEIFIECNYVEEIWQKEKDKEDNDNELNKKYKRQLNTHQSLENLIIHLKEMNLSKCDKITLIHISQDLGNRDLMKNTIIEEFGIECVALLPNGIEY